MASLQREKRKACREGFDSFEVAKCNNHAELAELKKGKKKPEESKA